MDRVCLSVLAGTAFGFGAGLDFGAFGLGTALGLGEAFAFLASLYSTDLDLVCLSVLTGAAFCFATLGTALGFFMIPVGFAAAGFFVVAAFLTAGFFLVVFFSALGNSGFGSAAAALFLASEILLELRMPRGGPV